jgi:uncharacterized protein (UPF0210 family)
MEELSLEEVYDTIRMTRRDNFDIRTTTLGIDLLPAIGSTIQMTCKKVEKLIKESGKDLVNKAEKVSNEYGIPIINKRITITPAAIVLANLFTHHKEKDIEICVQFAKTLDKVADDLGIDFIGGFGCLSDHGATYADKILIDSLPRVMAETRKVCAFVSLASTKAGINMPLVMKVGKIIKEIAENTEDAIGCAKLVVFANAVNDNPFMAGGFHGLPCKEKVINVGISGPGVVRSTVESLPKDLPLDELANEIKKTAFRITRAGELIGKAVAKEMKVKFGSVDISLAPTTQVGDSVGEILELMGLEMVGTHGTTAALMLLTDAVKKGGIMASANVGGLSGAFIPVSEDRVLSESVRQHCLTLDKLEAMTAICSVGLDMVAIPGDTRTTTIAGIIADEMAIGVMNHKTTAVRLIPVPGKKAGDKVDWGGLLGGAYIVPVHKQKSDGLVWRKGHIPAPITSFKN